MSGCGWLRHKWGVIRDHGAPAPGVTGNHWVTQQCFVCGKTRMKIVGTTLTGPK